MERIAET